ncbi:MAG: hypothetical protein PVG90_01640 [Bacillota bacterium]
MQRLRFCRIWLLIVVMVGLVTLEPLESLGEHQSDFQISTVAALRLSQSDRHYNPDRPHWDYPDEFMLAANWTAVANYSCFGLKPFNLNGVKAKNSKVLGKARRLHLVSLVILLFYIFYLNSRTTAEADPLGKKALILIKFKCLEPFSASECC